MNRWANTSNQRPRWVKRPTSLAAQVLCCAVAGLTMAPAAHADQLSRLEAEVQDLSAQIAQLKTAQAQQAATQAKQAATQQKQAQQLARPVAVAQAPGIELTPMKAEQLSTSAEYVQRGAMPHSFLVPGTNTSLSIGGFINFQGIYDPTENLGPKFAIGNLDPKGSNARAQSERTFHFQDKVSRLVVGSSTPSPYGNITTNFGLDFYGFTSGGDNNQALQNNSWGARIVTAYGTIGPFLVGMANSNFIDDPDSLESFDNAGPAGLPAARTPQVRYTMSLGKGGALSFALENPQTGYQDTRDNIEANTKTNPFPDLSVKYEREGDWGHFQVSGIARDLGFTDMNGARKTKFGAAALMGVTLNLPHSKDNVGGQVWYGALGRYLPDDFGANVASVLAVNNGTAANPTGATNIEIQPDVGAELFFQHWWTHKLRSNLGLGYNHQQLASWLPADPTNAVTTKTVHVNLIYRPVPTVDVGLETMYGQKTFQAGTGLGTQAAWRVEAGGIWHF
ncbi:MAG: DcaP family trimeric outer membrane transporter [Trinickia sp.]|uniref:DcaP family trimeric outer membrane transporter n=1 Tax=Trinickia sp. TaxID=2571163 RepID=UPI003F80DCF5